MLSAGHGIAKFIFKDFFLPVNDFYGISFVSSIFTLLAHAPDLFLLNFLTPLYSFLYSFHLIPLRDVTMPGASP